MKKFILFPLSLLIIGLSLQSCFNNPSKTISTMIILKDVDCQNCYDEISKIIKSEKGLINYTIAPSTNAGKKNSFIIILIEYKKNYNINQIKMDFLSKGYVIDDNT